MSSSKNETADLEASDSGFSKSFTRKFHIFFITVSAMGGCVFIFKLFNFLKADRRDELSGFAFDPVMVYAFVAMGFMILLTWSYLTGQFRDIEQPKYEMFERFAEQERQEFEMAKRAKNHE